MENNIYLGTKSVKKKKALKGVWFILVAAVVFIVVILRYVHNSEDRITSRGLPEKEDAYKVAKAFLKADSPGSERVDFADDGFSFGKKTDSIYVIRSTFEKHLEGGDIKKGSFSVTMRFKGGISDDQNSWDLLNINKD
jgi:hypothetical protein